jgi:NCS2 family nucleobase:cation symporter-2
MIVSGVTTFLQLYPLKIGKLNLQIGSGLPIVMGTAFAFVPTAIAAGKAGGISGVLGGCFSGALVVFFIGAFYQHLKRFFSPLVIGSVLVTIGVHLLDVGVNYFAGGAGAKDFGSGENLFLGFIVFAVIVFLQRFGKGMWKVSSILSGLIVGYIAAIFMGKVNFDAVTNAGLVSVPVPLHFGFTFDPEIIFSFAVIYVVCSLETIGNTSGITIAAFDREATATETSGAIMADAFGCLTAATFNTLPNTAFGQNAGIVAMTKVVNKWCIATGAATLIIAGLFPKVGAVFSIIPNSVLGGAVITVFAMIMINGIKMIAKAGFNERNVLVLGITFGIGLGLGSNPAALVGLPSFLQFIFKDTVACVCIVSIIANLIFPEKKELSN